MNRHSKPSTKKKTQDSYANYIENKIISHASVPVLIEKYRKDDPDKMELRYIMWFCTQLLNSIFVSILHLALNPDYINYFLIKVMSHTNNVRVYGTSRQIKVMKDCLQFISSELKKINKKVMDAFSKRLQQRVVNFIAAIKSENWVDVLLYWTGFNIDKKKEIKRGTISKQLIYFFELNNRIEQQRISMRILLDVIKKTNIEPKYYYRYALIEVNNYIENNIIKLHSEGDKNPNHCENTAKIIYKALSVSSLCQNQTINIFLNKFLNKTNKICKVKLQFNNNLCHYFCVINFKNKLWIMQSDLGNYSFKKLVSLYFKKKIDLNISREHFKTIINGLSEKPDRKNRIKFEGAYLKIFGNMFTNYKKYSHASMCIDDLKVPQDFTKDMSKNKTMLRF